jgi:CRISPR/Cas system-associated protein Cas7 (RAMP superfamily)
VSNKRLGNIKKKRYRALLKVILKLSINFADFHKIFSQLFMPGVENLRYKQFLKEFLD